MTDNKIKITKKIEELLEILREVEETEGVEDKKVEDKKVEDKKVEDKKVEDKKVEDIKKCCPLFKDGCPFKGKDSESVVVKVNEVLTNQGFCKCNCKCKDNYEYYAEEQYNDTPAIFSIVVFFLLFLSFFLFFKRLINNMTELCNQ